MIIMAEYDMFLPDWFLSQSTGVQIAIGIVTVLLVIAIFALVVEIIKGVFWLVFQIVKLVLISQLYLTYIMLWVFLIAPIQLVFSNKRFSEIWSTFKKNNVAIFYVFYPKDEEEVNEDNEELVAKKTEPKPTKEIPMKNTPQVQVKPTYVIPQVIIPPTSQIQYHCTTCGNKFSPNMVHLISSRNQAFCEDCGQKFELINNIPNPIHA
jgi:DNA-directed RNA polymerase subunit RPC12/RpoP